MALSIAKFGWMKRAQDIIILDVSKLTQYTDYLIVMTADVDIHVKAIADYINEKVRESGEKPHHVEGYSSLRWVLMDFIDVVVHIQLPEVRDFYGLENLWGDAVSLSFDFSKKKMVKE